MAILRWVARSVSLVIIIFGLPFYFGYGNPLPFLDEGYTLFDNTWLIIFPLMFIGLALGWKYEIVGGYVIAVPIVVGFIISVIVGEGFSAHMLFPLGIGALYLWVGYKGRVKAGSHFDGQKKEPKGA
ncbi:MAG: hypothetical protein JW941_09845 [Candidatus Coatesbacteria bacterium]|nr:hypothetical protein [Candidatus Coatesbacteria bacterium]